MGTDERKPTWLDLYDWRQRVAAIYAGRNAAVRAGEDGEAIAQRFRSARDDLFAHHPQSPLGSEARKAFAGLRYFPYDPAWQVEAVMTPIEGDVPDAVAAEGMRLHPAARVRFTVETTELELTVFWIDVYGGGLFLPFRDATCPKESYGGGRYLFDTVKGSDFLRLDDAPMSFAGGRVLLDFNYAYNPSCAYDDRWVCPLAPPENRLSIVIRAGEQHFHD
jgi:uncharacterized protein (DUF1684 family)